MLLPHHGSYVRYCLSLRRPKPRQSILPAAFKGMGEAGDNNDGFDRFWRLPKSPDVEQRRDASPGVKYTGASPET